jgi:cellulase/cellobiase CelA1
MKRINKTVTSVFFVCGLAYFVAPVQSAQAATEIYQNSSKRGYDYAQVAGSGVANAYLIETNAWNIADGGAGELRLSVEDNGDWTVKNNTSPDLSFPNILRGNAQGQQSNPTVSGLPAVARSVATWPIGWDIETPDPSSSGRWNSSIEFWFNSDKGPAQQANRLELMIWLGYAGDNSTPGGFPEVANVEIGGVLWRVHAGRAHWGNDSIYYWNYVAFVPKGAGAAYSVADNIKTIHTDFKKFFNATRDLADSGDCRVASSAKSTGDTAAKGPCLNDDWWVTSVQAGFELFNGGVGLASKHFTSNVNGVTTDRTGTDGKPVMYWGDDLIINATGCNGVTPASATYSLSINGTPVKTNVSMGPQNSNGYFSVNLGHPYDQGWHGDASYTTKVTCGSATTTTTNDFYIDPSGVVIDQLGNALVNATVTLYRSATAGGPFAQVPNGDIVMSPKNTRNPDQTGLGGHFGWDVAPGYYKVRAAKTGCVSPSNPAIPYVETAVMTIPPPVTDIKLQLSCPVAPTASVVNYTDWGTGYCANVVVKNTTGAAWDWIATFPIDGTIYTSWNGNFSVTGGIATVGGIAWNNILAKDASTQSVGFCANRSSTPGTPAVTVTKTADWITGYCATVTVTNNTSSNMTWNVNIPKQGTIYTSWNGVFTTVGSNWNVRGVSWNAVLKPGEHSHDVGFCANR